MPGRPWTGVLDLGCSCDGGRNPAMALNTHKSGAAFPEMIGRTALGAAGLVLSASSAWIALANKGAPHALIAALVDSATVAILVGVGLFAWERDPASRFGVMLVAAGFGSFLASLSASGDPLLYSGSLSGYSSRC